MGLEQGVEGLATTAFSLIAKASYLPVRLVTLLFRAEKNFGQPSHPCSRPLARWQLHLDGKLMSEQALSQGAVESFNAGLVSVNVNALAPNTNFLVFHFFGNSAHELFSESTCNS